AAGRRELATGNAEHWIERLGLEPHPGGGYFRETYKADLTLAQAALRVGFTGARVASTAIYFLLEGENFSAFHRLRSDELWHFYVGGPFVVHVIRENGQHSEISIGSNPDAGEVLQAAVKAGFRLDSYLRQLVQFALT